jgi:hypothetical protein
MNNTSSTQKILSDKSYFVNSLKDLKDKIESISLFHQTKILNIFYENNIPVNENKNGVFINLTYVDSSILDKIYKYLIYVNKQEEQLNELEEQKQKIATSFFS